MTDLQWVSDISQLAAAPPTLIHEWMAKPYILSQALKRICNTLSVKVIDQRFEKAFDNEYKVLEMQSNEVPFVRQVLLQNEDNIALTYGRVIIPPQTYELHFSQFEKLGTNLIGETLLYNNPDVTRGPFEYVYVNHTHEWAQQVFAAQSQNVTPADLWGRRSLFSIKSTPILVTELFLPSLPSYVP